jgi:aminoglycoside phosphotransferase (APT) family kinase protein
MVRRPPRDHPVRADSWRDYLEQRAARSLFKSAPAFNAIDASELAADLPNAATARFVHLDAFAGNMLAVGSKITAVIDIGITSAVGDPRLDPLACAAYLSSSQITPSASPRDLELAVT